MKRTDIKEMKLPDANCIEILLFPDTFWSKEMVFEYLKNSSCDFKNNQVRIGLSHIVFINLKKCNLSSDVSNPIYSLLLDHDKMFIRTRDAYIIKDNEFCKWDIEQAIDNDKSNLLFDIKNFGFIPKSNSDFVLTAQNIQDSLDKLPGNISKEYFLTDLIQSNEISENIKKMLLDVAAINAAYIYNSRIHFLEKMNDYVQRYSALVTCTFLVRAMIEKLILLLTLIDDELDFSRVQGSKSIKASFLKQAKTSRHIITTEFIHYLSNVEILDDNYRTPETHKMGRIFGILNYDIKVFNSLYNEISSHYNKANPFFSKLIKHLRQSLL